MKKLNNREVTLLIITICIAIFTITYIYIVEPFTKSKIFSNPITDEYKKNLELLTNEKQILNEGDKIFSQDYWKNNLEQQQLALQIYIQNIISKSNITDIKSIVPLQIIDDKISIEIDLECSLAALTRLIYEFEKSVIPIKITNLKIQGSENDLVKSQIQITSIFLNT